jgi:type II secretory pathway predicted ATPase ExeA
MWSAILRNGLGVVQVSLRAGLCRNQLLAVVKGTRGCRRELPGKVYDALVGLGCELGRFGVRSPADLMLPIDSAAEVRWCRERSRAIGRGTPDTVEIPAFARVAAGDYWKGEGRRVKGETTADGTQPTEDGGMITSEVWTHFGLKANPWRPPAGPQDLYLTPAMRTTAELLRQAARDLDFVAIAGEVGCGKTTCLRYALEPLAVNPQYRISHLISLARERVNARAIQTALLMDLSGDDVRVPSSAERLSRRVKEAVHTLLRGGQSPVLVIDQAQSLSPAALVCLKTIRDDYARGYSAGVAVLLSGQSGETVKPDLKRVLGLPSVREVALRITVLDLPPLGEHLSGYVLDRFARAGAGNRKVLTDEAMSALTAHFARTAITPLEVHSLLSSAMELAWRAGQERVTAQVLAQILGTLRPAGRSEG